MSHPPGFPSRMSLNLRAATRGATAIAALMVTLALPLVAGAARPWQVLEDSFEVSASSVRLPDQRSGALSVLDCDGCRTGRFGLADDAVFSVAGQWVTYAEFLAAFRGGRYRSVYFDLRRESGEVSRVRIYP